MSFKIIIERKFKESPVSENLRNIEAQRLPSHPMGKGAGYGLKDFRHQRRIH